MMKPCENPATPRSKGKNTRPRKGKREGASSGSGLKLEEAVKAAGRCLGTRGCQSCDICSLFCPELCITREEKTQEVKIDLNYCKGCGICAVVCPKGAIQMVLEKEE